MIIGAGVAGLAAIESVRPGVIVRAFDTRPKKRAGAAWARDLELDFEEEVGSGDGYAKVMSEAFIRPRWRCFADRRRRLISSSPPR